MSDTPRPDIQAEPESNLPLKLNDAVEKAKLWLRATMQGENVSNLGLEEVEHSGGKWYITLGFSRPWDGSRNALAMLSGEVVLRRTYKIVTIDEASGEVLSMKNWTKE